MATVPKRQIVYPTSDGKPMAETEPHLLATIDVFQVLREHYEADPMVYVGSDMMMFYEEGERTHRHLAPDVFVVLGIPNRVRMNYLIWEEGKAPDVVFEFTSPSTKREDLGRRSVGSIATCWASRNTSCSTRLGEYLNPRLQGYRLVERTLRGDRAAKSGRDSEQWCSACTWRRKGRSSGSGTRSPSAWRPTPQGTRRPLASSGPPGRRTRTSRPPPGGPRSGTDQTGRGTGQAGRSASTQGRGADASAGSGRVGASAGSLESEMDRMRRELEALRRDQGR